MNRDDEPRRVFRSAQHDDPPGTRITCLWLAFAVLGCLAFWAAVVWAVTR